MTHVYNLDDTPNVEHFSENVTSYEVGGNTSPPLRNNDSPIFPPGEMDLDEFLT